jgi:hypothetical protein
MTLTDEERKRFANYCLQEARDYDGLAKQVGDNPTFAEVVKYQRKLAAAHAIVGQHLMSAESFVVGGEEKPA